ncbi:tRNA uridine(34) 5-carboxymethylaminomethyl modification radical SAM/GNAT enzyme Elp3 [Methanotorris igneus]|uniref:tRNA carboxymethyluridine synthase n=1 Tax=Methanotorris igneus (strain DSM 5666 / JCM 11834 / Kol 5) TaxID=880724 RepID=F6BDY3_METIK|nr:tRNA uridine(34) 5-carboxymethylaminomethyl modification radical SAM/GNAT enzyme Elp3 [Methanotorris igneus]AEF96694.1 histone acetyltransferase, ELP3 family [Methanotorris igneus Kol 5]
MDDYEKFMRCIIENILNEYEKKKKVSKDRIEQIKSKCLRKFRHLNVGFPLNSEILKYATEEEKKVLIPLLRKKPVRTLSGVAVVAVMTSPEKCPHGKCMFCPGGKGSVFGDVPQSYTGREPATMRGLMYKFDPYEQTKARLEQLEKVGHPTNKVELIIMGGTFPARDIEYQDWFIKGCLDAMNKKVSNSLEEAQKLNETAEHRCVALCIETRPDYCREEHINQMLKLGATRVELGVQSIYNDVLKFVKRGHTVEDTIKATQLLKDSGLKVSYHMMPGLPNTTEEMDKKMFYEIFNNPDFKPDLIKIYPCLVVRGTEIYDLWKKGEFKPLNDEEAVELISYVKSIMPKWVRTSRIQRDIPATVIVDGVKKSNLGELVYKNLERKGIKCKCIRCREVGHVMYKRGIMPEIEHIKLCREEYIASGGTEIFLSYEDLKNDILIAYLRLRIPYKPFRKEIDDKTALVRQLHVCGQEKPLTKDIKEITWQHKGYGKMLLKEAERIAKEEFGMNKILVTSGIGVREYYRRLGYERIGAYMGKYL